jgi:hypothetical protein
MAAKKTVQEIDETRAALALEWMKISTRIQPDLDRIAVIRAELETLPVLKYSIPGVDLKVDVSQGSTFQADLFMAKYPITTHPQYYKAVPDTDRINKGLAPDELAGFKKANKTSVKLV